MGHYYIHSVNLIIIFQKTKKNLLLMNILPVNEGEQKRKEISLCVFW